MESKKQAAKESMRILVLNYEFPPIGGGGGRVSADFSRELARSGHQVLVQTVHLRGLPHLEKKDGYTIRRCFSGRRRAHTCTVGEMEAYLLCNFLPVWKQTLAWQPDILHVHFAVPTGVLGWLMHKTSGVPYVLSVQLGDIPGGNPDQTDHLFRWLKPLTRPIWRDAAAITAPSAYIRRLAHRSYRVPITVLPNPVDLSRIPRSPEEPQQPPGLFFAGRFNPQKNLLFLVEVLERVADLPWNAVFCGDGPLWSEVQNRVRLAGLSHRISFPGWVSPERVQQYMSRSDLLLLPSLAEGLPVVGLQALGAGLAILGSDIGGLTDLVQKGINGFLCPLAGLDSFAACLRTMLTSPRLLKQMKQASRRLAAKFGAPLLAGQLAGILRQALNHCS